MTDIDRRSMIKMAGAGLILAGNAPATCPTLGSESGASEPWGALVTKEGPDAGATVTQFNPDYLCVLYVRFTENRTLKVRTAWVRPTKPYQVAATVKPVLIAMRNNGHVPAIKAGENFENFTFGSQHLLVIYIDNDPKEIGFDDRFGEEYIIRFTSRLASNPNKTARENYAFYNLKRVELDPNGPLQAEFAYQMEFWNTTNEGHEIEVTPGCPKTYYLYSMNIHLKMAVRTSAGVLSWVPVILDPDTGNTGGDP